MVDSVENLLLAIKKTLEETKGLLILINQERISEVKKNLLPEGTVKSHVYDLCDGTRTTKDIANALQKSNDYVNSYLSILRREGLVSMSDKDGVQVHEQIV